MEKAKTLDKLHRDENSRVAAWLLYYHERKRQYEEVREELMKSTSASIVLTDGSKPRKVQDPTARQAVLLADKLGGQERWLRLVEDVEQQLPWKMQVFLRLRREARSRRGRRRGRPAWIPYVQHKYCEVIAERTGEDPEDVWISSPDTFSNWWNRIINYTAREAAKRGLL